MVRILRGKKMRYVIIGTYNAKLWRNRIWNM